MEGNLFWYMTGGCFASVMTLLITFSVAKVSFLVALVLSLLTIAIAWIVYRPLLGIGLLIIAGGVIWKLRGKLKRKPRDVPAS